MMAVALHQGSEESEDLRAIRRICASASELHEGATRLFYLPDLVLPRGAIPSPVLALLAPVAHNGYPSRLYLDQQVVGGTNQNWRQFRVLERNWWACSVQGIGPPLTPAEMLIEHLARFR